MKQEYILVIIIGLLILAYVLDAVVNPLKLQLHSPYHYFDPAILSKYTFTTTSIVIKSIALFLALLWFLSFLKLSKLTKGAIILVISGLMQLYALQDVATNAQVIPLEWSLALTLTGVVLLIPAVIFLLLGITKKAYKAFSDESDFDFFAEKTQGEKRS